jgi:hypothetical protein
MSKKRYIEIESPLPLKDRETAITRMRGERWRVDTSEPTVAHALQRKGHVPVGDDDVGHYLRFELPANALTFRSLFTLEDSRRAENLPNGVTNGAGSTTKPAKVGEDPEQESTIDDGEGSSVGARTHEPKEPRKYAKGGEATDDGFEASIMAKASRSARGSS